MTIPTTPAECRAEQERVLKLLEGTTPGEWASSEGDPDRPADVYLVNPQHPDDAGMGKLLALIFTGKSGRIASARWDKDYAVGNARLMGESQRLARQYTALLDAHAEALAEITEQQDILDKIAEIADAECEFEDARLTAEENRIEAAERKLAEREAELEHLRKLARRVETTMGVHEHLAATKELIQTILTPAKETQP